MEEALCNRGGCGSGTQHLSLRDAYGQRVDVQIFYSSFQGPDGEWEHIVGINEVGVREAPESLMAVDRVSSLPGDALHTHCSSNLLAEMLDRSSAASDGSARDFPGTAAEVHDGDDASSDAASEPDSSRQSTCGSKGELSFTINLETFRIIAVSKEFAFFYAQHALSGFDARALIQEATFPLWIQESCNACSCGLGSIFSRRFRLDFGPKPKVVVSMRFDDSTSEETAAVVVESFVSKRQRRRQRGGRANRRPRSDDAAESEQSRGTAHSLTPESFPDSAAKLLHADTNDHVLSGDLAEIDLEEYPITV